MCAGKKRESYVIINKVEILVPGQDPDGKPYGMNVYFVENIISICPQKEDADLKTVLWGRGC